MRRRALSLSSPVVGGVDGVEEPCGERQRPRVRVDLEDTVLDAGIPISLEVFRRAVCLYGS